MKRDKDYIWAKFCSTQSNEELLTQLSDLKSSITDESDLKLIEMIKKDQKAIDKAAYMYDDDTNKAWGELHSKIMDSGRGERRIKPFTQRISFRIAASIILLLGFTWIGFTILKNNNLTEIQTVASQRLEVLPDGTTVHLNANSKIEYSSKFNVKKREVTLSGEAFFDVIRDENRPFIIKAGDASIEVLGTSFNILAIENKKVEVLVESGTVSLSGKQKKEKLILTKGQIGSLFEESLKRELLEDLNYLSWKTKKINFKEAPLTYVIDVLNKTYTTNISVDNKVFSDYKLNATFDKAPLPTVLESICLAFDLEKQTNNGRVQLVAKTN